MGVGPKHDADHWINRESSILSTLFHPGGASSAGSNPGSSFGASLSAVALRCHTARVSLPCDLAPEPIAFLACPAWWPGITKRGGEFLKAIGPHRVCRLYDYLLNHHIVFSPFDLGFRKSRTSARVSARPAPARKTVVWSAALGDL